MQDIHIGRYNDDLSHWGGYIEPEDRSWIIYLDGDGRPEVYFPYRDETGGVTDAAGAGQPSRSTDSSDDPTVSVNLALAAV